MDGKFHFHAPIGALVKLFLDMYVIFYINSSKCPQKQSYLSVCMIGVKENLRLTKLALLLTCYNVFIFRW